MLLSAVSVLVVAQSIFEIPEGLMNNPVHAARLFSLQTPGELQCAEPRIYYKTENLHSLFRRICLTYSAGVLHLLLIPVTRSGRHFPNNYEGAPTVESRGAPNRLSKPLALKRYTF